MATEAGQVTRSAAEVYEAFFVPALFAQWAPRVVDAACVRRGMRVLDVACGTGVLACHAADRLRDDAAVVGLDRNEGMLAVARRKRPSISWRSGRAEALPFPDEAFDAVASQFGLMFFEDRGKALGEMHRVLRPGGRLAVAVWDSLERSPGYAAMTRLISRLFGEDAADAMRAPFCLGARAQIDAAFASGGLPAPELATLEGSASFPSLEDWVRTDIKGWTLADMIDDRQLEQLLAAARTELAGFVDRTGAVRFAVPAHIATLEKARR